MVNDKKILVQKLTTDLIGSKISFLESISFDEIDINNGKLDVKMTMLCNLNEFSINENIVKKFNCDDTNATNLNFFKLILNRKQNDEFNELKDNIKKSLGFFYNVKHRNYKCSILFK
jgi:hypothetical protein